MKRARIFLTMLVTMLLAGCSTLPTSGPVTGFERDLPDSDSLVLMGYGPVEGSSPEVLVRDFMRASAAGWSDDFQVARAYLTEEAKASWRPESQVQIYPDDQTPVVSGDEAEVSVRVGVSGLVTPDGKYAVEPTPSMVTEQFGLAQDAAGEWRINQLPDGLLISQSSFHAAYTLAFVYFPTPDFKALVADPRWYPLRGLESHLMQALIEGPSADIEAAVTSAIPSTARIPLQRVTVSSSVAAVELEGEDIVDPAQQAAFKWQVTSTLKQVPGVSEVRVSNNNNDLDDVSIPAGPLWAMDKKVGISENGLELIDGPRTSLVVSAVSLGNAQDPSIGPVDASPLAFVNEQGLYGVTPGLRPQLIYEGAELSRPSVDRLGWIWTSVSGGIVVANLYGAEPISIATPWTTGDPLVGIAVSPDGARALLRRGGDDGGVWVASVIRSTDGTPTGLDVPRRIEFGSGRALDMSWAGNTSMLILQDNAGERRVTIATIGSVPETLKAPDDAVRISGGATPRSVMLDTANNTVYTRSGASWRSATTNLVGETFPH